MSVYIIVAAASAFICTKHATKLLINWCTESMEMSYIALGQLWEFLLAATCALLYSFTALAGVPKASAGPEAYIGSAPRLYSLPVILLMRMIRNHSSRPLGFWRRHSQTI